MEPQHTNRQHTRLTSGWALALLLLGAGTVAVTHAQISPYPVVVTMTGPATAVPGQEITYLVQYRLADPDTIPGTSIVINIPQGTTFVSSEVVSGPAGTFVAETDRYVRWADFGIAGETEGEVALIVRIDNSLVGPIHGGCYIPGTETSNPESRCSLETQVLAPAALPEAGAGGRAAGLGLPVALALLALALVGAALFCAAATRMTGVTGRG